MILTVRINHMAKAKKTVNNPHDSLIIQGGVIFIVISAIAITAYAFATHYPAAASMGAGY